MAGGGASFLQRARCSRAGFDLVSARTGIILVWSETKPPMLSFFWGDAPPAPPHRKPPLNCFPCHLMGQWGGQPPRMGFFWGGTSFLQRARCSRAGFRPRRSQHGYDIDLVWDRTAHSEFLLGRRIPPPQDRHLDCFPCHLLGKWEGAAVENEFLLGRHAPLTTSSLIMS